MDGQVDPPRAQRILDLGDEQPFVADRAERAVEDDIALGRDMLDGDLEPGVGLLKRGADHRRLHQGQLAGASTYDDGQGRERRDEAGWGRKVIYVLIPNL